jgi:hypothetical protein
LLEHRFIISRLSTIVVEGGGRRRAGVVLARERLLEQVLLDVGHFCFESAVVILLVRFVQRVVSAAQSAGVQ